MALRPKPQRPDPLRKPQWLLTRPPYTTLPITLVQHGRAVPLGVMVRGTLEWLLDEPTLERLFREHAPEQYTRELTLSTLVGLLIQVSAGTRASVYAAYQADQALDEPTVATSYQAVYGKLGRLEPEVGAAVVRHSADRCGSLLALMPRARAESLPGYRDVAEGDGDTFVALEYIEGGTLADKLDGTPQRDEAILQTARADREKEEALRQSKRAQRLLVLTGSAVNEIAANVRSAKVAENASGNAGSVLFELACFYARASKALGEDAGLSAEDRVPLAEQYAVSAVRLLNCAKQVGFFGSTGSANRRALESSPDLTVLRSRADYKRFVARLL